MKPWTFMIYMAADNDLAPYAKANLSDMARVVTNDVVNVIALIDWPKIAATDTYRIRNSGHEIIERVPNIPSYQAHYLASFIGNTMSAFPAENYCLVLWGHGDGIDWKYHKQLSAEGIATDSGGNFMKLADLGTVFDALPANQIGVLAFDACLMSMAEVQSQVKHSVNITVASIDEIPKSGFPYGNIFKRVLDRPSMQAEELVRLIVDEYVESYASSSQSVSLAASRLCYAKDVASVVQQLASSLMNRLTEPLVLKAIIDCRQNALVSQEPSYVDLGAFCFHLYKSNLGSTSDLAGAVLDKLENHYVLYSRKYPKDNDHRTGVSVLLPLSLSARKEPHQEDYRRQTLNAQVDWNAYKELSFSKDAHWSNFIDAFVATHP